MEKIIIRIIAYIAINVTIIGILLSLILIGQYKTYIDGRFEGREKPTLSSVEWRVDTNEFELHHDNGYVAILEFGR